LLKFVARRLVAMIPILLGIILVTLLLLELMPGDPAEIMAGEQATPEAVELIRKDLRLDQPLWERFVDYSVGVVQGDLGRTPISGITVWSRMEAALPITLALGLVTMTFVVILGISGGVLSALRQGRFADRAVTAAAAVVQAIPPFVVGLALVIVLAVDRSWFPTNGYVKFGEDPYEWFRHLVLPALTLALRPAAEIARQTRGALVDTMEQDYIRASRAKGLPELLVVGKHAAKNAATPVVTVLGLQVGAIVGGAVIVELIYGLPGFGALALNAVVTRDLVLIQGVVLISALFTLAANLAVDVSYGYLNPKVRV
jgi:peptide/nickel transport system permease protein